MWIRRAAEMYPLTSESERKNIYVHIQMHKCGGICRFGSHGPSKKCFAICVELVKELFEDT